MFFSLQMFYFEPTNLQVKFFLHIYNFQAKSVYTFSRNEFLLLFLFLPVSFTEDESGRRIGPVRVPDARCALASSDCASAGVGRRKQRDVVWKQLQSWSVLLIWLQTRRTTRTPGADGRWCCCWRQISLLNF